MNEKVMEALDRIAQTFAYGDPYDNAADLATIRAHIEGLEADARRYRWLRDGGTEELCVRAQGFNPIHQHLFAYYRTCAKQLDAAIDSAMQENRDG